MTLSDRDVDELVRLTQGFSGADLKNLSVEAAMIPLRSLTDIANVDINNIRATGLSDFRQAIYNVKASVDQATLQHFLDWNSQYGSF
jgi:SpoVK/Ycf46/Vps4 family AAA+-type ATPase